MKDFLKNLVTKPVAAFLAVVLLAAPLVAPQKAAAQFIVSDPTNLIQNTISAIGDAANQTKDYVLDTLVWQVGNLAIESITKSLVNWINSGFQGSPAFVTDLNQNLRGVGDAVANRFFKELSQETIAITPFQDKVLDAVRLGYYLRTSPESFYTRYPYTLNQVSPDSRAFLEGDFSQGGWNAWFATVMNPQNNPYGSTMLANEALSQTVSNATNNRVQELSWNRGFLSWRGECTALASDDDAQELVLNNEDPCIAYEIQTPGSVIMEQLNNQFGASVNRLVSADEFNEIVGALLNQLVSRVLSGGDNGGLRGLSRPTSGGGTSFVEQASSESTSGIAKTFTASVANQVQRIQAFKTSWESIKVVAEAAQERCGTDEQEPALALERAATALSKAADSLAALESIQSKITTTASRGGNQSQTLLVVSQEYQDLSNSDTLPTPEEMADAQIQSQDSGDTEPSTLYTRMKKMVASRSCALNSSNDEGGNE